MSVMALGSNSSMPNFTMAVRLAAADFHDVPWPGREAVDFPRQLLRQLAVAIFVEVFHGLSRRGDGLASLVLQLGKFLHLLQIPENLVRLFLIDPAEGESRHGR